MNNTEIKSIDFVSLLYLTQVKNSSSITEVELKGRSQLSFFSFNKNWFTRLVYQIYTKKC